MKSTYQHTESNFQFIIEKLKIVQIDTETENEFAPN